MVVKLRIMKITILSVVFSVVSFLATAQISGDIKDANRSLVSGDVSFVIQGNHIGKLVYDISVDNVGNVTGIKLDRSGTTVASTPSEMKARKYVKSLKFEKGTHFPEFHDGRIVITMVKPK